MIDFRSDLAELSPYKVPKIARYNLGDNENRLIDWSDLLEKALQSIRVEELTHYGDNQYQEILNDYASYLGVDASCLVQGVGSDQLIQTIITTFLQAGDQMMTLAPDFFMYNVFSKIHGVTPLSYPLSWDNGSVQFEAQDLVTYATQKGAKIIFLSNPNNPGSFAFNREVLETVVRTFSGLVVIDEAYIEFSQVESMVSLVSRYENLIVLRTLSKAFGLAGLRLGFSVSAPYLAKEIDKVLAPYSLPNIVGKIGSLALSYRDRVDASVREIIKIREDMIRFLRTEIGASVMQSQTNFVTFSFPEGKQCYEEAKKQDINFKYYEEGPLRGYIRLTIGKKEEMDLIKELIYQVCK